MVYDNIKNTNVNDPNVVDEDEVPFLLTIKKSTKTFCYTLNIRNKFTNSIWGW